MRRNCGRIKGMRTLLVMRYQWWWWAKMHKHISICIMLAPSHHLQDVMCVFCDYMLWYVCVCVCTSVWVECFFFVLLFVFTAFAIITSECYCHRKCLIVVSDAGSVHTFWGLALIPRTVCITHCDFDALSNRRFEGKLRNVHDRK